MNTKGPLAQGHEIYGYWRKKGRVNKFGIVIWRRGDLEDMGFMGRDVNWRVGFSEEKEVI